MTVMKLLKKYRENIKNAFSCSFLYKFNDCLLIYPNDMTFQRLSIT